MQRKQFRCFIQMSYSASKNALSDKIRVPRFQKILIIFFLRLESCQLECNPRHSLRFAHLCGHCCAAIWRVYFGWYTKMSFRERRYFYDDFFFFFLLAIRRVLPPTRTFCCRRIGKILVSAAFLRLAETITTRAYCSRSRNENDEK